MKSGNQQCRIHPLETMNTCKWFHFCHTTNVELFQSDQRHMFEALILTAGSYNLLSASCVSLWDVLWGCSVFCPTLASHSIPATEIPSSRMTVRVPTIRMSFSSSVIKASTSCNQQQEQYQYEDLCKTIWHNSNGYTKLFLTLSISTTVSAKPTTYMATATALAKAKMRPMDPPNSGPRLLEIR